MHLKEAISNYELVKNIVMTDAMQKLYEAYLTLIRTDVAIIWLLFMKYTAD